MTSTFYAAIGPTRDALIELLEVADFPDSQVPTAKSEAMRELSHEQSYAEKWGSEPVSNAYLVGAAKRTMAVDCANAMLRDLHEDPRPLYAHNVLSRAILENAASAARLFEPGVGVETRVGRGFNEAIFSHQQVLRITWLPDATRASRKESIELIRESARQLGIAVHNGWIAEERLGFTKLIRWLVGEELGRDLVGYFSAVTHGTRYGLMAPVVDIDRSTLGARQVRLEASADDVNMAVGVAGSALIQALENERQLNGWEWSGWLDTVQEVLDVFKEQMLAVLRPT